MDFKDSPEEATFRDQAATWLKANVPAPAELEGLSEMERGKLWQKRKADAGWACIRWPEEYGGRGANAIQQVILNQEESKVAAPATGQFSIGQGMAAPTMMTWATEEQKTRFLPKHAAGEEIWCQLFSEPGSGSDAAALRSQATRTNEGYQLNGTKAFISGGGYSDAYIVMARTGAEGPKGISAFILEAGSDGLSYGALEDKMGWRAQPTAQVQFDACPIPAQNLLGEEGKGFQYAMDGLDGCRLNIAASALGGAEQALQSTLAYMGERKAFGKAILDFQNTRLVVSSGTRPSERSNRSSAPKIDRVPTPVRSTRSSPCSQMRRIRSR